MVLLTGVAGFIGMHVAARLLDAGEPVLGVDHLGPCAEPALQRHRLARLQGRPGFRFVQADLAGPDTCEALVGRAPVRCVIHLAAQTGVRYGAAHPQACVRNNVVGFANLIEACRMHAVPHLLYASSSSIYGANPVLPFSERHRADHPLSLYAATKRSNELLAHCYSHQFGLPTTGLRLFTVYGPWGRPDMAPMLFARAIRRGRPIEVFNGGRMQRDFTYIDDVVEAVLRLAAQAPAADGAAAGGAPAPGVPAAGAAPFRVYNVGSQQAVALGDFIAALEQALGRPATRHDAPMQGADMRATWADTRALAQATGFAPATPLATGIDHFVRWLRHYDA